MYTIDCTIEGTAPLLQHRFPIAALSTLMEGARRKTASPDYRMEWLDKMYVHDGRLVQPAAHVEAAMARAASGFRIKGSKNKTYRDIFRAYVLVSPEEIPLAHGGVPIAAPGPELLAQPTAQLCVNVQRVIVARAAVARSRLQVNPGWRLSFTIEVHDDQLRPEVVEAILRDAGQSNGLGDYRPRYGRFRLLAWDVRA